MQPINNGIINFNSQIKLNIDQSALDTQRVIIFLTSVFINIKLCDNIKGKTSDRYSGHKHSPNRRASLKKLQSNFNPRQGGINLTKDKRETTGLKH